MKIRIASENTSPISDEMPYLMVAEGGTGIIILVTGKKSRPVGERQQYDAILLGVGTKGLAATYTVGQTVCTMLDESIWRKFRGSITLIGE